MSLYEPKFQPRWSRRSLWDTATWVNGLAFRDISFADSGDPIIKIAELKSGITAETRRTRQTFDSKYRVVAGDVLYSWSGSPETSLDVFVWRGPPGWLNQHIFKITPDADVDPGFHIQLLRYLRPHLVAIATNKQTTGLGHVTKQDMQTIVVGLPALTDQRAIADVLGSLDDKIELNRRTCETLEGIVRALFKSWFVDFDAVRAKAAGEPTDSICRRLGLTREALALFPTSFERVDTAAAAAPWPLAPLSTVATLDTTSVKPFEQPETLWEHYSIPAFDEAQRPALELGSTIKSNKYVVKPTPLCQRA